MTIPKARTVLAFVFIIGYIVITGAFFGVLFFSERVGLPEGEVGKQIIGMLGLVVGTWNAGTMMILTFNYGTSQGSVDKGKHLEKMENRKPPAP
jgi:hypothetical protein